MSNNEKFKVGDKVFIFTARVDPYTTSKYNDYHGVIALDSLGFFEAVIADLVYNKIKMGNYVNVMHLDDKSFATYGLEQVVLATKENRKKVENMIKQAKSLL